MKKLFMLLLVLFVMTGCNKNNDFEEAIREGKDAVTNEEYDKALTSFESALVLKNNDAEAKELEMQTEKMLEAIQAQQGANITQAIALFDEVETMKNSYNTLSNQAKKRKELLQQNEQDKYTAQLQKAENLNNQHNFDEAQALLDTVLSETENIQYLSEQHEKATTLLVEVKTAATNANIPPSHSDSSDYHETTDTVFIDYATEESLQKYSSYEEFIADKTEGSIICWSDEPISNFRFIEIGSENEGSNFSFFQEKVLYALDTLSPEKPIVIKTIIAEGTPNRGISYIDATGKERYFYISWSGFDGSLSLVEFTNQQS